jgi:hypothetical protein
MAVNIKLEKCFDSQVRTYALLKGKRNDFFFASGLLTLERQFLVSSIISF